MRGFAYKIHINAAKIFLGYNFFWHLLAIALTYILAASGFDWFYFQETRSALLRTIFFPAVEIGAFVPIFGILIFFAVSFFIKNKKLVSTAFTLGQAAILGFLTADFYKFFTGRPGPPGFITLDFTTDISHVFRFGILKGGVFFGWPSTHTSVAFAMAVALIVLYPKNKWVWCAALVYALYIGIGVSMTIHWFSDFAAGIIFGSLIGIVVGKSFFEKYFSKKIQH